MKIEVEKIYRFDNGGQLKAFVDISLENMFVLKGFRVVEGKKGLFVSYPSEIGKDGKWYNTIVAITDEAKGLVEGVILKAYKEV